MRRREPARALGPYPQENQWRVIQIDAKGRRKSYMLDSRQAAHRLIAKLHSEMHGRTVEAALDLWIAARLRSGTSVKSTVQDQAARARSVLSPVLALHLDAVTERKALALYEQTTQRPSRKSGRPLRAATHHFYLAIVQRMWRWAQKQGYAKNNPWAEVEPLGRPSVGKAQLRPAEARRFAQVAEEQARAGSDVALAALCCLSLGLRASEALGITARDVDAEAGEVYINGTKTAAARRRLKVSPNLGRLLVRAASGRQPEERLCLAQRQALHSAVIALCARAGVPRVCVHGLRGTHASLAVSGGASVEAVARVLGHTSVKMTLGHYVTDEAATGARLAAVEAALTVPESFRDRFSEQISDGENESPLLSMLSAPRRVAGRKSELNHCAPSDLEPPLPLTDATVPQQPDPSRHSAVCCCILCEQHGTGEQAMRAVGGDYARFRARVASSTSRTDPPAGDRSVPTGKRSHQGVRPTLRASSAVGRTQAPADKLRR